MNLKLTFVLDSDIDLIEYLKQHCFSDSLIMKLKKTEGALLLNGDAIGTNQRLHMGDQLVITLPPEDSDINPLKGNLDIVYEDDYILVLNKPHNVAVIGTIAHYDFHLSGMIMYYYRQKGIKATVHLVNRLDKDTSGLIIIAKHQYIHALMVSSKISKKYRLQVHGVVTPRKGVLDFPIIKDETYRSTRYLVSPDGKPTTTLYRVISSKNPDSEIEVNLLTGKTHQIRVHFAHIGHPVIGDVLYGNDLAPTFLHLQSYYLAFVHPITQQKMVFRLPKEW